MRRFIRHDVHYWAYTHPAGVCVISSLLYASSRCQCDIVLLYASSRCLCDIVLLYASRRCLCGIVLLYASSRCLCDIVPSIRIWSVSVWFRPFYIRIQPLSACGIIPSLRIWSVSLWYRPFIISLVGQYTNGQSIVYRYIHRSPRCSCIGCTVYIPNWILYTHLLCPCTQRSSISTYIAHVPNGVLCPPILPMYPTEFYFHLYCPCTQRSSMSTYIAHVPNGVLCPPILPMYPTESYVHLWCPCPQLGSVHLVETCLV